jgi:hypothetical protein
LAGLAQVDYLHIERRRLASLIQTWPDRLAQEFVTYRQAKAPPDGTSGPYWRDLPIWLLNRDRQSPAEKLTEILEEIGWGQFCFFLALRIQDDLIDGQTQRPTLGLCSSLFLLEGERALASVIRDDRSFAEFVRATLRGSIVGILRARVLQKDPRTIPSAVLEAYGEIDSVFSIGGAAVCSLGLSVLEVPRVTQFVREMGKVLQTFDDIEDLEEDHADGRLTFPALVAIQTDGADPGFPPDASVLRHRLNDQNVRERIVRALDECLIAARSAVSDSGPPEMIALMERCADSLKTLKETGWGRSGSSPGGWSMD